VIGGENSGIQALNTKLHVSNFPPTHTKEMIYKICEVFGKVKTLDLLKDPATGEFKGQIHVEYNDEIDAKKAHTGLMGFKMD
jgi:splicing factor U2AF 65 kDa subunit